MPEKKTLEISHIAEWTLKLVTSQLNTAESLELKRMIYNDCAPEISKLDINQIQEMMTFLQNAADVLMTTKSACDIIRKEKLDALPAEKKEQLSKDWTAIQERRAKSGVAQTKEKDPKTIERKAKTEEGQKIRKVAAQRLSAEERAIKIIMSMNPKLSKDQAMAQLKGTLK